MCACEAVRKLFCAPALLESEDTSCTKSSVLSKGKAYRNLETWALHIAPSQQTQDFGIWMGFFHSRVPFPDTALQQDSRMCIPEAMKFKEQSKQRSLLLHQAGPLLQVASRGAFQGLVSLHTNNGDVEHFAPLYRVNFRPAACHSRQKHCWLTHLCRFFCSK